MTLRMTTRRRFVLCAAVIVLALTALGTSAAQTIVAGGLVEFVEITERIVRFPCWLMDHNRRSFLDRLDPTCPQCI